MRNTIANKYLSWVLLGGVLTLATLSLQGCSGAETKAEYPRSQGNQVIRGERETIWGEGGFSILGGKNKDANTGTTGIGVNSFLWQASLETLSFMPLASADPFGGVILTDWYIPDENQNERFKVNTYILDRRLRADGIRVSVFRQSLTEDRGWVDQEQNDAMARELENAILIKARQLRMAQQ